MDDELCRGPFADLSVHRPLLVVGTRPEAIKMAPVIQRCQEASHVDPVVCFTGQHREMLQQVADHFGLTPDVSLNVMRPNQTLSGLTTRCLEMLDETVTESGCDGVVAQGDTTTVLAASMVAFYRQLPFVHVEAGLRTHNMHSPWPEEFNRRVAGLTARLHCAPTQPSADNLLAEGVPSGHVKVTGNTVIDALLWTVERERANSAKHEETYPDLQERVVLITGHRRENHDQFESICSGLARLADSYTDTTFVYPVHLNPNVQEPVHRLLGGRENIRLVAPAAYPEFIWLMDRATLIISDSGGVQEEAPSLGKPVLCMRDTTERPEAVHAGAVKLIGTDGDRLFEEASTLLDNPFAYAQCQVEENPYGDGHAASRIVEHMTGRAAASPLRKAA